MIRYEDLYTKVALKGIDDLENLLRQSGRTTEAVSALSDGDVYVVHTNMMVHIFQNLLNEKGIKARVIWAPAEQHVDQLSYFRGRSITGKIVFDHVWSLINLKWRIHNAMCDMINETRIITTICSASRDRSF